MLQNVNLEEVRQYNSDLKQYKDKAANLNAEIEYTNKEIDALCAELTAELGKPVTRDNIEQIYNEQVESINSTLQSGKAVLEKIASEERGAAVPPVTQQIAQPAMGQPVAQPMMTQQVVQPTAQPVAQPVIQQEVPVANPQVAQPFAAPPVQGSVFNGQPSMMPGQQTPNQLPPMFKIT